MVLRRRLLVWNDSDYSTWLGALSCIASTFGVLNLPLAIAQVGLVPGTLILLFGWAGSWYTAWQLYVLVEEIVFSSSPTIHHHQQQQQQHVSYTNIDNNNEEELHQVEDDEEEEGQGIQQQRQQQQQEQQHCCHPESRSLNPTTAALVVVTHHPNDHHPIDDHHLNDHPHDSNHHPAEGVGVGVGEEGGVPVFLRIPYIGVVHHILGPTCARLAAVCVALTGLGTNVVILILVAQNCHQLWLNTFTSTTTAISEQWTILLVSILAIGSSPMFGTLHHSAWFVTAAVWSISVAVLLCLGLLLQFRPVTNDDEEEEDEPPHSFRWPDHHPHAHSPPTFSTVAQTFGSILFSFGGHTCYPTYQAQMGRDHARFRTSINAAYTYMGIMMQPFTLLAPMLYGTDMTANFMMRFPATSSITVVVTNVCFTVQAFSALAPWVLPMSDLLQHVATKTFGSSSFGWPSYLFPVMVQSMACVLAMVFWDNFANVLAFVGSTTMGILTFLLPTILFLRHRILRRQRRPRDGSPKSKSFLLLLLGHWIASLTVLLGSTVALVFTVVHTYYTVFGSN
ncbi:hypothetical protein ACA910_019212 [Epithemia clementina (nom. ined.)]